MLHSYIVFGSGHFILQTGNRGLRCRPTKTVANELSGEVHMNNIYTQERRNFSEICILAIR